MNTNIRVGMSVGRWLAKSGYCSEWIVGRGCHLVWERGSVYIGGVAFLKDRGYYR